ncbi:GNAT family N-acetyltransferase [Enterococcus villorum]|uniref:GNAT family N-acetyltransferase n=1 Tax=Enterococcus villorum TaxID=112904 RepID=A0A1V8YEN5_9ENTE|nr:GNAT family N-acetyltransferase [Enterococcus villorum]OQO71052.1 GNAT family N-acetyltransferase [Enterococcus villorum]OQO76748.1 GNAT family N-acetyltransferase [Enterococcus villorum]
MLDKHIPYAEIWMSRPIGGILPNVSLPDGYHFECYTLRDERSWAQIEVSVGEFETKEEGMTYFQLVFFPYQDQLQQRMLFVVTESGKKIATGTAWYKQRKDGCYPLFHWLAVMPEHQGKGIARALTVEVLRRFQELETHGPIYLRTQTWSHPAIKLYQKLGFSILPENFDGSENKDYPLAMKVLEQLKNNKKSE